MFTETLTIQFLGRVLIFLLSNANIKTTNKCVLSYIDLLHDPNQLALPRCCCRLANPGGTDEIHV